MKEAFVRELSREEAQQVKRQNEIELARSFYGKRLGEISKPQEVTQREPLGPDTFIAGLPPSTAPETIFEAKSARSTTPAEKKSAAPKRRDLVGARR
jgi:hypothetical protein